MGAAKARVMTRRERASRSDMWAAWEAYMSRFGDVQTFVREANRVADLNSLRTLLEDTVKSLGFDYFALLHHVDLARTTADFVRLVHYPQSWKEKSAKLDYYSDDPILAVSQKTATPFLWTEVPRMLTLSARQEEILNGAQLAGIGNGVTVPINIPGEYSGSCSFSMRTGREIPIPALPTAQYLGCFAFQAARRVVMMTTSAKPSFEEMQQRLSPRQLDCVILVGRGKSDRDVGQLLGISGQTVHQHIEEAKRRYNVATRQQLIVRALFDAQITFADLIN
jgi:LuxR family transcriptional regulator, quorum-sensing system regulator CciR